MMMKPFTTFSIPIPNDFNQAECLWFLDRGFYDCRYRINQNIVWKLLEQEKESLLLRIHFGSDSLAVGVLGSAPNLEEVEKHIRQWFDLDRDLSGFYQLGGQDPILAELIPKYRGLRLIGEPDLFETLCWAIIGQQVNLTFAYQMKRNLVEAYGDHITYNNYKYYGFPSPALLAGRTINELKKLQLSRQKSEYILNLAQLFSENKFDKNQLAEAPDFDTKLKLLTSVHGIGPWTANYALMRSLKETSAFPIGDAGLQNALKNRLGLTEKPSQKRIKKMASSWSGWEAYAVLYLWRTLADIP